jgi:beta-N-acetylhexosaminidase
MVGPVILDLKGPELEAEEREILQHPLVGGIILFSRHYESPVQIAALCSAIHSVRREPLLIAVDHEGGRVQRFRTGFTPLPPMRQLGIIYDKDPTAAMALAEACGWLIASELFSVNVDLSFTPVLDLDRMNHTAIGDRAFHSDPLIVSLLARAFIQGMHHVGMAVTGKHFPGHGGVIVDSHVDTPIDARSYEEVAALDMIPFIKLIQQNLLDAVMPAHILFQATDEHPVGFSSYWLKSILRERLGFKGIIISDDLNMKGAAAIGNYAERAKSALQAGCDLVLICNNRQGALQILDGLSAETLESDKIKPLLKAKSFELNYGALVKSNEWKEKHNRVVRLTEQGEII